MTAPTAETPAEATSRRSSSGASEELAAPEPPKLRRRPMLIALSVLLTALGALLGAWLLTSLSGTKSYIAVGANVERGEIIKETDLVRTQLRTDQAIAPLNWSQQPSVVGMYAATDMAKGSLVTRDSVAAEVLPTDGQSLVGLSLVPGQTVAGDLRYGQLVRVVIVPASVDTAGAKPTDFVGTVAGSRMSEDGSTKLVDVMVSKDNAPSISAAASRQEVSLVLDPKSSESDDAAGLTPSPSSSTSPSSATSSTSN